MPTPIAGAPARSMVLHELLNSEAQVRHTTDHSGPVLGQQEPHTPTILVDPILSPLDSEVPGASVYTLLREDGRSPRHSGFREKADP